MRARNPIAQHHSPFFPDHNEILKHCLSAPEQGTGKLGTEPEALIDAVVTGAIVATRT